LVFADSSLGRLRTHICANVVSNELI
jgi:hypothetical protein